MAEAEAAKAAKAEAAKAAAVAAAIGGRRKTASLHLMTGLGLSHETLLFHSHLAMIYSTRTFPPSIRLRAESGAKAGGPVVMTHEPACAVVPYLVVWRRH